MLQFTGRESQYCVSAVGGFTGDFARREGGMAAGLLRQWPLLLLALLSTAMITESANAGVIKLNAELPAGGDMSWGGLQFSPDGSRVLYRRSGDGWGLGSLQPCCKPNVERGVRSVGRVCQLGPRRST